MSEILTVEVRGADAAAQRLERAASELSGAPFQSGVTDAARLIETAARGYAPVATGRLRASLTTEARMKSDARVVVAVGSSLAYAPAVEYGGRRRRGRWFLRRALADQGSRVLAAVRRMAERMTWNG
ncbi:MAG: HK97 gp10 family phage protein [Chloroflexi bacterium]|nr:HK97 gp10 family phage protein [Chloroflexota bacterium]